MDYLSKNKYGYLVRLAQNPHFRKKEKKVLIIGEKVVKDLISNSPSIIDFVILTPETHNRVKFKGESFLIKESGINRLSNRKNGFKAAALINSERVETTIDHKLKNGVYTAVEKVQNPENLGMIFRTCEAFGVKGVFLINHCVNPLNQKSVDTSTGSVFNVPYVQLDSLSYMEDYKSDTVEFIGTDLEAKKTHKELENIGTKVIFFGNEGQGLSKEALEMMDYNIKVKIKHINSLNIAVSHGVITSHLLG